MAAKILLDANIVLDFLLKRKDYEDVRKVMVLILEKKVMAFISASILHIVSYWLTKSYGSAKSKDLLLLILSDIAIIDANREVVTLALTSPIEDIEDALQYYTAVQHRMDFFITKDRKFQEQALSILPVYNVSEFLKLIN